MMGGMDTEAQASPLERLPWDDVASTNVRRVAWTHEPASHAEALHGADPYSLGRTWVQFRNGGVYRYDGVPRYVYTALLEAASVGSYVARVLRHQYPTTKIGDHPFFQHG